MTVYAHVTAGTVDQIGQPPALAYDGSRWWDLRGLDPQLLANLGWLPVTDTTRPADTATTTWDRSYTVTGGTITAVWTERAKTADELAAQAAATQRDADRTSIISTALVWLAADSQQAAARAQQIAGAITALDTQIASVQGYTFAGATVTAINTSLNSALKPQLVAMLQRQRAIGVMLQELMVARDRHGDALVWLGRYLTS